MSAPNRNIELKARCPDLPATRAAAIAAGAVPTAVLNQIDTYFQVPHGRLKLREINGTRAELIQYNREDATAFRHSDYRVVPVPDPALLKSALEAALGLRGVVTKRRELLLYQNVRIHLDEVKDLGTFLEFEAVLGPDADEPTSRRHLAFLEQALHIRPEHKLAHSYADLLFG